MRFSIARKLEIENAKMITSSRYIDGVVEMRLDATQNYISELTTERLK